MYHMLGDKRHRIAGHFKEDVIQVSDYSYYHLKLIEFIAYVFCFFVFTSLL